MANTDPVLGEIRAHLGRQGYSQRWLSEQIGINQGALSRRLRGERSFTVDELQRVAAALGVTAASLLEVAA